MTFRVALLVTGCLAVGLVLAGTEFIRPAHESEAAQCASPPDQQELRSLLAELMKGSVPLGIEPQYLPSHGSRGANLLKTYCAQCHALPTPRIHSGNEWPRVVERMVFWAKTMETRPCPTLTVKRPSQDEQGTIVDYLKQNAFEPLNSDPSVPVGGKGGTAYLALCSQCHDLPHPRQHLVPEWPSVVDRMQDYAFFIGRKTISDEDKAAITEFLQTKSGSNSNDGKGTLLKEMP